MEKNELLSALEAVLFASGEAMPLSRLASVLDVEQTEILDAAHTLKSDYSFNRRGMRLVEMNDKLQLVSAPEFSDIVRRALETRKPPKLTSAALETLAVTAYHQPVTKSYIEQLRGTDSSYTLNVLVERGLIEEAGRLPVPGRPILYCTTELFLRSFGISSLDELPELPEDVETDDMKRQAQELVELIQLSQEQEVKGE